jgi:hypothetical protein
LRGRERVEDKGVAVTFQPDGQPVWEARPTPAAIEAEPEATSPPDRPRGRVTAIVLSTIFAGLSLGSWFGIAAWRTEVESLRAEAADLGHQVAVVRANEESLNLEKEILADQNSQGLSWIASLTTDTAPVLERTTEIAAVAGRLDQCALDWENLVARYWVSSSSALASTKQELSARCDAALADLNRLVPEGWGY